LQLNLSVFGGASVVFSYKIPPGQVQVWAVLACLNFLAFVGLKMFWKSNLSGQIIIVVLFIGSIYVWTIMFTKAHELRQALKASDRLKKRYGDGKHPASLFVANSEPDGCPFSAIYVMGCSALSGEVQARGGELRKHVNAKRGKGEPGDEGGEDNVMQLEQVALNVIRKSVERATSEEALKLESSMGWLASATTSAPFLGLLGTVLGVMDSFGAMGEGGGSALITQVGPGISAALLTTVVGLIVAIPSSIGYNRLGEKIRTLCVNMENFAEEFMADVERFYAIR